MPGCRLSLVSHTTLAAHLRCSLLRIRMPVVSLMLRFCFLHSHLIVSRTSLSHIAPPCDSALLLRTLLCVLAWRV